MTEYTYNEALITACENEEIDLVKCLIQHGADISYNNYKPLQICISYKCKDILFYLLEEGIIDKELISGYSSTWYLWLHY